MHVNNRNAGARSVGFPVSDPGADFDPDAGADEFPDSGPVPLAVAVYRDAYWRALADALAEREPDALAVAHRDAYNHCVRLQRAAVLRRTISGRLRSAVCRSRFVSLAARRSARGATASPSVMM